MSTISNKTFQFVDPRQSVEIHLPDERVISGPRNAPLGNFLNLLETKNSPPIVGGIVNGELRELTYPIKMDAVVQPITMADTDGGRIYRRSLIFLLEVAFHDLFPDASLTVDHSVAFGGYYCQVSDHDPLSPRELKQIEDRMRALVKADLPFERQIVPLDQAIAYFKEQGEDDKVRLLSNRTKNYLTLYQLADRCDYHHGYLVPSTRYLKWFELNPTEDGFTLRFPRRYTPTKIQPLPKYPKLLAAFRQYSDWLNRLGISSVGALNEAITQKRINELILVSEALHEQQIAEIAAQIAARRDNVRVILIAGPSSSGKTTFSKRLTVQLLARGISPYPVELDNYFVDRELTPRDEKGNPDFESINTLNRARLSHDLKHLIAGETVQLPRFDFISGKSLPGSEIQLQPEQILILEGIHGLNPALIKDIAESTTYRIYVSALTQLNLDRHNRISTTDTRLLRRIVRDSRQRGYTAWQTIQRWESVQSGEKKYIFPYQENADIMFNSALVYELSALKPLVEPLLRQVPYGTMEYVEAKRLLAFLEWFIPIGSQVIPDNSILREFLGDSIMENIGIWHNQNGKNHT